jgi:PAS domain S-box-containing protein
MKRNLVLIVVCLLLLFISQPLWAQDPKRVLFISAYHPGFPSFFLQVDGVKTVFAERPIQLDIEFMDTKRFPGRETFETFYTAISSKMSRLAPYDAIIVADDNALVFAIEYQRELFNNLPIVFLGVNNIELALQQNSSPAITGVVEAVSMKETVALILKLHPTTKRIVALVDSLPSGQVDLKHFYSVGHSFPTVNFSEISLAERTFDSFAEQLRTLGDTDVALLLSAYQDAEGNSLMFEDSLELINENLSRPLYHLWQHGMGQGVLGGKLVNHYQQGVRAAEAVLNVLDGTPIKDIPVNSVSPNRYAFDYLEMKKFGLRRSLLPDSSEIYNEPRSFYSQHKTVIWFSGAIFWGYSVLLFGMSNNIRVRKKAQNDLKESEKRLKDLIDQSPVGLALFKLDGSLVTVNPAYAEIIGYSVEETLQLTYWDITPKKYASQELDQLKQLETIGRYGPCEKEYQHKDGYLVPVRFNRMILIRDDEKYIWSSVENITAIKRAEEEKRRLEEQLRQSQKLEAVGNLAGGIAHDFNNSLAAILGYTEIVLRSPDCEQKSREKLVHVLTAAKRAKELVKQILMFSRKGQEHRKIIKIAPIVDETIQLLRSTIPTTVAINLDIESEMATVLADSTQIHQVIMNLCTNAYHAIPKEVGDINISLRQVNVDSMMAVEFPALRQGEYAFLSVSDTGNGIPSEDLARIFEPFYTTKKQGEGTGLGLAVVYGIIRNHDGAILVDSTVGKGTTFKVYLPLARETVDCDFVEKETENLHGTERILVIDDEIILTKLVKETLESLGYRVVAETSGEEALARFRTNPKAFDLIITDQTMPQMTGDVFAQKALQVRPDIPIIVCTGHSTLLDTDRAKSLGIKALLIKSIEGDRLAMEVRKAIGSGGLPQIS